MTLCLLLKWPGWSKNLNSETYAQLHFKLGGLNGADAFGLVVFKVVGNGRFYIDSHPF